MQGMLVLWPHDCLYSCIDGCGSNKFWTQVNFLHCGILRGILCHVQDRYLNCMFPIFPPVLSPNKCLPYTDSCDRTHVLNRLTYLTPPG
jgi:hypothetical protein